MTRRPIAVWTLGERRRLPCWHVEMWTRRADADACLPPDRVAVVRAASPEAAERSAVRRYGSADECTVTLHD